MEGNGAKHWSFTIRSSNGPRLIDGLGWASLAKLIITNSWNALLIASLVSGDEVVGSLYLS